MTLSDHYTITTRDIHKRRVNITVSSYNSSSNINKRPLRLAHSRILNSSTPDAAISSSRILRLVTDMRLRLTLIRLTQRQQMNTRRRLLAHLALDMRYSQRLYTARKTIDRRAAMLPNRKRTLHRALISSVIQRLYRAMCVDLSNAMIAALSNIMRRSVSTITVVLVILHDISAPLYHCQINATEKILSARIRRIRTRLHRHKNNTNAHWTYTRGSSIRLRLILKVSRTLIDLRINPLLESGTLKCLKI